jgi:hypothetical protein
MTKLFTATSLDSGTAASRCNRLLVLLLGLLALPGPASPEAARNQA